MKIKLFFLALSAIFVGGLVGTGVSYAVPGFFAQGGNSFLETAVLGTTDNFDLSVVTNNTEVARFDTNGNLGIGTSNPTSKLYVAGDGNITGDLTLGGILNVGTINSAGVINVSTSRIANVTDPVNDQDAATKKYVDDNSGGSIKTLVNRPITAIYSLSSPESAGNSTLWLHLFNVPQRITVNKLFTHIGLVNGEGTIDFSIYSEDGQRVLLATSNNINWYGKFFITVSPSVTLEPGNYYFAMNFNTSTTSMKFTNYSLSNSGIHNPPGEAQYSGRITIPAGETPLTIDPKGITYFDTTGPAVMLIE